MGRRWESKARRECFVMAGHSGSKDGVTSARLCPGHPCLRQIKDIDTRHQVRHNASPNYFPISCRIAFAPFVYWSGITNGARHADEHANRTGLEAGAVVGPPSQRSRDLVPAVRWRDQARAMADCHRDDGQDRLWVKRDTGAVPGRRHDCLHRALRGSANVDPRRDPADGLSRWRGRLAPAHRQSAVYAHPVRGLSRVDGVGWALAARQETTHAAAVAGPQYMIRKGGYRFSLATNAKRLRGDHAQTKSRRREFVHHGAVNV